METLSLLQEAKLIWEVRPERYEGKRFYHISTDEICVLQVDGTCFTEFTKYDTHRLYSTNKASSDYFVRDYMR
jgi:dTDP-glucose 4,6-dehydratase